MFFWDRMGNALLNKRCLFKLVKIFCQEEKEESLESDSFVLIWVHLEILKSMIYIVEVFKKTSFPTWYQSLIGQVVMCLTSLDNIYFPDVLNLHVCLKKADCGYPLG